MQPILVLARKDVLKFMRGFSKVEAVTRETYHSTFCKYIISYTHSSFAAKLSISHFPHKSLCTIAGWEVQSDYDIDVCFEQGYSTSLQNCLSDLPYTNELVQYRAWIYMAFEFPPKALDILSKRFQRWPGKFKKILKKSESFDYSFVELLQQFQDDAFFEAFMSPMVTAREELDKVLNPANAKSSKPLLRI